MTSEEIHPIKDGYIPKCTTVLIIGTFPPKKEYTNKKDGFFFYSSERNQFWNRIDNIFPEQQLKKTKLKNRKETFERNRERKELFSKSKGIGFIDIFTKVRRKRESTKDKDLISIETIIQNGRLNLILNRVPLQRICCTYALVYNLLKNQVAAIKYKVIEVDDPNTANGKKLLITGNEKTIEVILLFPATRSMHKGKIKDEQYNMYLFK